VLEWAINRIVTPNFGDLFPESDELYLDVCTWGVPGVEPDEPYPYFCTWGVPCVED
jgi:hypothetical protein